MAFRGEQITVTTTPVELTQLAELDTTSGRSIGITKITGAAIFLASDNTVTSSTGAQVDIGPGPAMDLARGDHVWAVTASGTAVVHVIETGV